MPNERTVFLVWRNEEHEVAAVCDTYDTAVAACKKLEEIDIEVTGDPYEYMIEELQLTDEVPA